MNKFVKRLVISVAFTIATTLITSPTANAFWQFDLETGLASSGYNDVRYPGTIGTKVSLSRELKLDQSMFWRARVSYTINDRHIFSILVAPLRLNGSGMLQKDVRYGDVVFPAMNDLTTRYRFDSYRFTYRYDFHRRDNLRLGAGITAKIRDASISIKGGGLGSEKKNTGFVPLVNFRADYRITNRWRLLLDGDALAAPQGRAEDVLAAVTVNVGKGIQTKFGYRILEGGADNDEIYTFALVNYLVVGAVWQF